ncbi:MAG: RsfS/YbeB/iojap family protein, partial [Thiobacillus sp.]|nr:RsfS/YbeB/iojap family protein [Thiobacillus sp.]
MNIEAKIKLVVDALEDIKGRDISVLDTSKLTSLFERMVIATGDSNRQTRALVNNVREKVKEAGEHVG